MSIRLVPPATPSPKQALIERIKKMPKREPGILQCNRCGSRTVMSTWNGSLIDQNGRYKAGTVCDDKVCYDCHKCGIWSPMLQELPRLVKEPKPRRTKPKIVK